MKYTYTIPSGSIVILHNEGWGWNLTSTSDWKMMTTEREVVYTKEDLWFSPYYDYPSRDEPLELSQNNDDENFNRVKNNFYGFRLPTSSRAHDYLLATKNCVIVKSDEEPSADPTKTAKHHDDQLIRRLKNVFGV